MTEDQINPPGLSRTEIDRLMDPLLSLEERQTAWKARSLGVQARRMQAHWRRAVRGPLQLGFAACAVALIGLHLATFSDSGRAVGMTMFLLWYPTMLYVWREYRRLDALNVTKI